MKRLVAFVAGILLIAIGIAGLVLPVLPGWALIFVGLSFIAPELAYKLRVRVVHRFSKQKTVRFPGWRRLGVEAGFTTRHFQVVLHKTDDLLDVETQKRFHEIFSVGAGFKPAPTRYIFLNQVHADNVAVVEGEAPIDTFHHLKETDGVITNIPGLVLLVLTADCLSVFFAAPPWIGLVHAGRRGTQKEISKKALRMISDRAQCPPSKVRILFGPCIRKKHYEVGPGLYFDIAGENKRQLLAAGAREAHIFDPGFCTFSENEDLYSFRKEKDAAGRLISFIVAS